MPPGLHTIFALTVMTFANMCSAGELGTMKTYKPKNHVYYIGENITVHCYLSRPVANTSWFDWGRDTVPRDYITVVNESYLRLDKEVNLKDPDRAYCYCYDPDGKKVGSSARILTENRPQAVKDLRYVFHDLRDFKAFWRLGVQYRLGLGTEGERFKETEIKAEYAENSINGSWKICELLPDGTGCTATDLKGWTLLSLRVTVSSKRRSDTAVALFDRLALDSREKRTSVTTDKPVHYVGDTMTVHCHLQQPGTNATTFLYDDNVMAVENITVVNDTYLRLDREVTKEDPAEAPCLCLDGGLNTVGAAYIVTEYSPQNVTDLVFEYYDQEDFRAFWNLGVTYKTPPKTTRLSNSTASTEITAEYSADSDKGPWRECELRKDGTGCTAKGLATWPHLSLRVTVANVWRNDTEVATFYRLSLDSRVKPAPVVIQKLEILNSTCAKLVWRSSKYYDLFHIIWNDTSVNTSEENVILCNLRPFNNYTVSVQAVSHTGIHGVKEITRIGMPPAVPSMGPKLIGGGYYRQPCSVEINQTASVHVYFKPVPPEERNGAKLIYTAQLSTQGQSKMEEIHLNGPESNTLVVSVPCGEGFSITMYASNEIGDSRSASLTIPAVKEVAEIYDAVQNMDLLVEEISREDTNKIASLIWNSSKKTPEKLRLFYCGAKTCRSKACTHWTLLETIDIEPGMQNVTFDSGKADRFGFAAATSNDTWTEIIFTKCIYSKDSSQSPSLQVPETPRVISFEQHINLSLRHERCETDNRVLTYYLTVQWCSLNICRYDNVNIPHNSSSTTYTLKDVEIHAEYSISMLAVTSHGNTSYSKPVKVTVKSPSKTGLGEAGTVGISSMTLIVVIILGLLLLVFCRSKLRTARMKFPRKLVLPIPHTARTDPNSTVSKAQISVVQKPFEHGRNLHGDGGRKENKKKQDDLESGYGGSEIKSHTSYLDMCRSDCQPQNRPHDYTMMPESSDHQHGHIRCVDKQGPMACVSGENIPCTPSHTAAKNLGFSQLTTLQESLDMSDHDESDQSNEKEAVGDGEACSADQRISSSPLPLGPFNKTINMTIGTTMQPGYVLYDSKLNSSEQYVKPLRYSAEISEEAQSLLLVDIEASTACSQQQNNKISDAPYKEDISNIHVNPAGQPKMDSYTEPSSLDVNHIFQRNGEAKPTEMMIHRNVFYYVSMETAFEINPNATRANMEISGDGLT